MKPFLYNQEYLDYICIMGNVFIYSPIISSYNVEVFEVANLSLSEFRLKCLFQ